MKSIRDFLPKKEPLSPVQAMISSELKARVEAKIKEDGFTWREIITAALQAYLTTGEKK